MNVTEVCLSSEITQNIFSMTIDNFIMWNNLRPVDAIIMTKKFFGMVDHYVLYMGIHEGRQTFVANYTKGVHVLTDSELNQFLAELSPKSIEKFPGNEQQREAAFQRAVALLGENSYHLISNNCEHYKNYVHYGTRYSKQAENFKTGIMVTAVVGLLIALFNSVEE